MITVEKWLDGMYLRNIKRDMDHTVDKKESQRASAILAIVGVEAPVRGTRNGDALHDAVLLLASREKMDIYEWLFTQIMGGGRVKGAAKTSSKSEKSKWETPEDAAVSDEDIIGILRSEELYNTRPGPWAKVANERHGISTDGFYIRIERLVAQRKVIMIPVVEMAKMYGREQMMNLKYYFDPETLKATDPEKYAKATGTSPTDEEKSWSKSGRWLSVNPERAVTFFPPENTPEPLQDIARRVENGLGITDVQFSAVRRELIDRNLIDTDKIGVGWFRTSLAEEFV